MTFLYFAYGSNMLTEWLRDRCPSAKPIGIANAANHKLVFGKRSIDNSGKATLVWTEGIHTPGVVFEIAENERHILDDHEGYRPDKPHDLKRYGRDDNFQIQIVEDDSIVNVTTYLANQSKDDLKPYDWYRALVITGAVQHGLNPDHINSLRNVDFDIDVELTREIRVRALRTIEAAGYEDEQHPVEGQRMVGH